MALKENYLTISEVAKELKVTRQTVSRWIRDGKIEAEQVGREKLINKRSLTRFLQKKVDELCKKMERVG
jgi:excisionase family DNA binding protein